MYACIYFREDSSIAVVGKNNKNLTVHGEFTNSSEVTMMWKIGHEKKKYSGVIIRVGEKEDELDDFASEANKVVKKNKEKENLHDLLRNIEFPKRAAMGDKRPRKETAVMKESREQDDQLSPKKKKKSTAPTKKPTRNDVPEKKELKTAQEQVLMKGTQEILDYKPVSSWTTQFDDTTEDETNDAQSTCLESTGRQIIRSEIIVQEQYGRHSTPVKILSEPFEKIPVPPREIIQFFQSLERPHVRDFIRSFCHHFSEDQDHSHYCYEQERPSFSYMDLLSNVTASSYSSDVTPMQTTEHEIPENSQTVESKEKIWEKSDIVLNKSSRKEDERKIVECQSQQSPRKLPVQEASSSQEKMVFSQQVHDNSIHSTACDEKKVRLVEGYDVFIRSDELKRIKAKAKTDKKPGYFSTLKLMPCLFSVSEMANSRGQGIKPAKENDFRPVLDKLRIQAIKAFAESFCKRNKLPETTESQLNDAITEAVAYARKKAKKEHASRK